MKAIVLCDLTGNMPTVIKALCVIRENAEADAAVIAINAALAAAGAEFQTAPAPLSENDAIRVKALRCDSSVEPGATITADTSIYHDVVPDP